MILQETEDSENKENIEPILSSKDEQPEKESSKTTEKEEEEPMEKDSGATSAETSLQAEESSAVVETTEKESVNQQMTEDVPASKESLEPDDDQAPDATNEQLDAEPTSEKSEDSSPSSETAPAMERKTQPRVSSLLQ